MIKAIWVSPTFGNIPVKFDTKEDIEEMAFTGRNWVMNQLLTLMILWDVTFTDGSELFKVLIEEDEYNK